MRNSTRRDRDRARLANESDTDRELRNSTRRDRHRARLANVSDTDREQHLSTKRDRARIRRQNLNRNTYNHLTEDNIVQDGPIASIIHINNGRIPDPFTLGLRDRPCYYNCNAKLFQKELDQTGKFFANTCCHRGHTVLQTDAIINTYPDELVTISIQIIFFNTFVALILLLLLRPLVHKQLLLLGMDLFVLKFMAKFIIVQAYYIQKPIQIQNSGKFIF